MYIKRDDIIESLPAILLIVAVAFIIYYYCTPYKENKNCTLVVMTRKGKVYTYKNVKLEWIRIMGDRPNIFIPNQKSNDDDDDE